MDISLLSETMEPGQVDGILISLAYMLKEAFWTSLLGKCNYPVDRNTVRSKGTEQDHPLASGSQTSKHVYLLLL